VSLTDYGFARVAWWHVIGLVVGIAWLVYWLGTRPVLARAAAVERGEGAGLINRRNRLTGALFALLSLALIGGAYAWTDATYGSSHIPLQVARVTPPITPPADLTVTSKVESADWRSGSDRLELRLSVHNKGFAAVRLTQLQIAELTVPAHGAVEVAPGGNATFTIALPGPLLREHNLLPLREPQIRVTALLFYADTAGTRQVDEIDELTSPVLPR